MTLHETLAGARAQLVAAGISQAGAAVDVDLYTRTILGWDRATLLSEQRGRVPERLEPTLSQWVARRAAREPSAYIVGVREFWGLDFTVTPDVLIPRPETEFVVEEALGLIGSEGLPVDTAQGIVRVADIGTGSGCVAVAVAVERPRCRVVASDVSEAALAVARVNAVRHGVADRIEFIATSYLDGIEGRFDLITANPPYVKDGDKPALARDVRHEPDVALFGGAEGLRDIAGVLETAADTLAPGGWLVMEFGYGQESSVRALVNAQPMLRLERVRADLQDIPRTAIIRKDPLGTRDSGLGAQDSA